MESHHSAARSRRRWLTIAVAAIATVALGIWLNPLFLLIGPMIFMHLFGHGSHHSRKSRESSSNYSTSDEEENATGCH